jgi:D-glycero-alpha-D-manno-heptose-7-phosphate kinase
MNPNFVSASEKLSREHMLKIFSSDLRVVPILDSQGCLVDIIKYDSLKSSPQNKLSSHARAPVRISFGGGGSDVTNFFSEAAGAVINSTISLYAHAAMRLRDDSKIVIESLDLEKRETYDDLSSLMSGKSDMPLIRAVIELLEPDYGFELQVHSDYPISSGLGGSSSVIAAVLGCFNEFRLDKWDLYELSELAYQVERLHLNIAGGWQDQYATVFGGVNFMEFKLEQNIVHPLRLTNECKIQLENSLVLCDTGIKHDSNNIHIEQRKTLQTNSNVHKLVQDNVELTFMMRDNLLKGNLSNFGCLLNQAWQNKQRFAGGISSTVLDEIYEAATQNGASGGKLLGAGGGGFFLFYVQPWKKFELLRFLESKGLGVQPFRFDDLGLRSWTMRETNSSSVV